MLVLRRGVQCAFVLFIVAVVWMTRYPLNHFINPAVLFEFDPLIMIVTSVAERILLPGLALAAATILVTFVFGRVFCGWLCPLGALSDFWSFLTGKVRESARLPRKDFSVPNGRFIKYAVLALCGALAAAGIQFVWLFDPLTIVVRSLSFSVIPLAHALFENMAKTIITATDYYPPLESAYHWVKDALFDPRRVSFPHASIISSVFVAILAAALMTRRFWCRFLCPLGALLALPGKFSFLKRVSPPCAGGCRTCKDVCRMGAIREDNSYMPSECVVCLDCVRACPGHKTSFVFSRGRAAKPRSHPSENGISRAHFFAWAGASLSVLLSSCAKPFSAPGERPVIRPPAALPEKEFVQRCVRCGNCMKVCVTNGLQPVLLESGPEGVWTPKLDPAIGYCEYGCTLCGTVCPTGALPPLTAAQKARTRLGVADIARHLCIPWATGRECLVCEEHCPVPQKAIQAREMVAKGKKILLPFVDADACVGCGLCQHVCPVSPRKAIEVIPS